MLEIMCFKLTLAGWPSGATLRPSLQIQVQYINATKTVAKPATKITMPMFLEKRVIWYILIHTLDNGIIDDLTYQTNAGSGNCKTMINPNATKIKARFTNMSKQQTPLVLGQNWKKSDSKEFVINLMLENFFCFKNWVWYGLKRNNRPMMSHSKIILFVNSFL